MNELALFAGAGGGILGGKLLGWRTVCAVERDAYAAGILAQRQNDGLLEPFPIWSDITTFDGRPWRGSVDVVSGGFPCQDISAAGAGAGLDGKRSGLWVEMARIIGEVRPAFCFVENSPVLTSRGLGRVLGDLAALGYDAEWGVLGAADVGAPHQRDRIWIVAHSAGLDCNAWWAESAGQQRQAGAANGGNELADADCLRELQPQGSEQEQRGWSGDSGSKVADAYEIGRNGRAGVLGQGWRPEPENCGDEISDTDKQHGDNRRHGTGAFCRERLSAILRRGKQGRWPTEPPFGRMAHGVANRVDKLRAIGNGQVPQCAAEAWLRLLARFRL